MVKARKKQIMISNKMDIHIIIHGKSHIFVLLGVTINNPTVIIFPWGISSHESLKSTEQLCVVILTIGPIVQKFYFLLKIVSVVPFSV